MWGQAHKRQQTEAVKASSPRGSFTSSCQGPADWPRTSQHAQQRPAKHERPGPRPRRTTPLAQTGTEDLLELPPSPSMLCLSELLSSQQAPMPPACSFRAATLSPLPFPTPSAGPPGAFDASPGSHGSGSTCADAEADSLAMQASLAPFMCCSVAPLPGQLDACSAAWQLPTSESKCSLVSSVCSLEQHSSMTLDACPELLYLDFSDQASHLDQILLDA